MSSHVKYELQKFSIRKEYIDMIEDPIIIISAFNNDFNIVAASMELCAISHHKIPSTFINKLRANNWSLDSNVVYLKCDMDGYPIIRNDNTVIMKSHDKVTVDRSFNNQMISWFITNESLISNISGAPEILKTIKENETI